jgi:hypothetical protein
MTLYTARDFTEFGWKFISKNSNYTFEDYEKNGRFCKSGLAYHSNKNTATCTSATEIKSNDTVIARPYRCDLGDGCRVQFEVMMGDRPFVMGVFDREVVLKNGTIKTIKIPIKNPTILSLTPPPSRSHVTVPC